MTVPVLLLGLTAAFLIGSLYHALRGGNGWRLFLNLLFSTLGLALGQAAGMWLGWSIFKIGALDVGFGAIGSVAILTLGDWLSRIKPVNESSV